MNEKSITPFGDWNLSPTSEPVIRKKLGIKYFAPGSCYTMWVGPFFDNAKNLQQRVINEVITNQLPVDKVDIYFSDEARALNEYGLPVNVIIAAYKGRSLHHTLGNQKELLVKPTFALLKYLYLTKQFHNSPIDFISEKLAEEYKLEPFYGLRLRF